MTNTTTCTLTVSTEIVRHPPQTSYRVRTLFDDFKGEVEVDFLPGEITVTLSRPPTGNEARRLVITAQRKLRSQNPTDGQILLGLLSGGQLSSPDLSYALGREKFLQADYRAAEQHFRDAAVSAQGSLRTAATALVAVTLVHQGDERQARQLLGTSGITFFRSRSHLAGELINIWRRERSPDAGEWLDLIDLLNLAHLCELSDDHMGAACLYGQIVRKHYAGVADYVCQAAREDYQLMLDDPGARAEVTCHAETGQLLLRKRASARAGASTAAAGGAR